MAICYRMRMIRDQSQNVLREKKIPQRTLSFFTVNFYKMHPEASGTKLCIDLALRTLCFSNALDKISLSAVKNNNEYVLCFPQHLVLIHDKHKKNPSSNYLDFFYINWNLRFNLHLPFINLISIHF